MVQQRSHDIAILGATGYTGHLVMQRLSKLRPDLKIVAASRHPDHIQQMTYNMGSSISAWSRPVDSNMYNSLVEFVSTARVLIACAGPFFEVGISVVKACVEAGTHYVDITGEVDFMRRIIDGFGAQARSGNVLVIPACGFDSVPSDLGVYCLQKIAPSPLIRAVNYVDFKGSFSGGTIRTLLASVQDSTRKAIIHDAYALNERYDGAAYPGKMPSKFEMDIYGMSFDHKLHKWLSPSVMAPINTRVVRRTVSLARVHPEHRLNFHRDFIYREIGQSSSMIRAMIPTVMSLFLSPVKWLLSWSFINRMVSWLVPAPGEKGGASSEQRQGNYFHYLLIGTCQDSEQVEVQIHGGDPYEVTAEVVVQAALCVLENEEVLIRELNGGGVFTPAYALGDKYLTKLQTSELIKFDMKGGQVDWESVAAA